MSRILLVDDSPHAQRMGERILSEEGYEVVTVSNADSALIRLDDVDPDVVLADTVMPGRTGYEICQYVKMSPRHKHVRVILTAGVLEPFDEAQRSAWKPTARSRSLSKPAPCWPPSSRWRKRRPGDRESRRQDARHGAERPAAGAARRARSVHRGGGCRAGARRGDGGARCLHGGHGGRNHAPRAAWRCKPGSRLVGPGWPICPRPRTLAPPLRPCPSRPARLRRRLSRGSKPCAASPRCVSVPVLYWDWRSASRMRSRKVFCRASAALRPILNNVCPTTALT